MSLSLFHTLRLRHPTFIYESFDIVLANDSLTFGFSFLLEPNIRFTPHTTITAGRDISRIPRSLLEKFVFHLGLIEMLSYWKAACCPKIVVQAAFLDKRQLDWWKALLLNGMGEFFYVNDIDFTIEDVVSLSSSGNPLRDSSVAHDMPEKSSSDDNEGALLLLSGGKDSALSVQILKEMEAPFLCLLLNPTKAAVLLNQRAGCKNPVMVRRVIDGRLLELNREGYLNGHTPFSAYLAYLGLFGALLTSQTQVIVSNERSSQEANTITHHREVNHQYSKTFHFEKLFREYVKRYLTSEISYFSLLRPLYEIQIIRIVSCYPEYFDEIKSCNRSQHLNSWCGSCAKCLSTFILFASSLHLEEVAHIFGKNLFEDQDLILLLDQLVGTHSQPKPFECVGTREETIVGLYQSLSRTRKAQKNVPPLLEYFEKTILPEYPDIATRAERLLLSWNDEHYVPERYAQVLKKKIT